MQNNPSIIAILVVVFTLTLVLLGVFYFILISKFYKKLKKRQIEALENLIKGEDTERQRISRDLHDEIGPTLSNVLLTLERVKTTDETNKNLNQMAKDQIIDAVKRVRDVSHNIASATLIKYGIIAAIEDLVDKNIHQKPYLIFNYTSSKEKFAISIESHLYNITQELILNSKKHSKADCIEIGLTYSEKSKLIRYNYQEIGNNLASFELNNNGIGIKNITTRVNMLNGKLAIESNKGMNLNIQLYE